MVLSFLPLEHGWAGKISVAKQNPLTSPVFLSSLKQLNISAVSTMILYWDGRHQGRLTACSHGQFGLALLQFPMELKRSVQIAVSAA